MSETYFKILGNKNREIYAYLYAYPNNCPYCHKCISPIILHDYESSSNKSIFVTFLCPNSMCDKTFIAEYQLSNQLNYHYHKLTKHAVTTISFSKEIAGISPLFTEIYNQAHFAEQNELFEICGVGYRKSLEFLIKDYLISIFPNDEENIKKLALSNCISTYIEDVRLKSTAKRATWLGNDHTHYEKKWENKNLFDLKTLIELSINWIEAEVLTKKFNESML
ncbi:hypothetical protein MASR2M117_21290 [Paludibacter sp.]